MFAAHIPKSRDTILSLSRACEGNEVQINKVESFEYAALRRFYYIFFDTYGPVTQRERTTLAR